MNMLSEWQIKHYHLIVSIFAILCQLDPLKMLWQKILESTGTWTGKILLLDSTCRQYSLMFEVVVDQARLCKSKENHFVATKNWTLSA